MKIKANQPEPADYFRAPAYPYTGHQLFSRLRRALTDVLGFEPSFRRLGGIIGEKTSVTHYWFHLLPHSHLIAFLSLMEHLPERKRIELLNEYCRELPSLENVRLAHDPLVISKLETLLGQKNGLTIIRGGTEFQRTFVLNALGHGLPRIAGHRASVAGLDVHEPRKWVPLDGVIYLSGTVPPSKAKQIIDKLWPGIRGSDAMLILLNSVWSLAPQLQQEILHLARKRHVIIADAKLPPRADLEGRIEARLHVITLASTTDNERLLRLQVEAA